MLENTIYRLNRDKKINIGYIGGSVTEGAGASNPAETSWVGLTSQWFKEKYPDVELSFVNAAVGGTNSDFGVYRIDSELIGVNDPDLFFVEFSINDYGWKYDGIVADMEGIVRKIFLHKPTADIIFVYTCTKYIENDIVLGREMESRSAHQAVAHYYGGIPSINIGEVLRHAVYTQAGGDWLRFTADNVHPNDDGYKICGDAMAANLTEWLSGKDVPKALVQRELPPMLSKIDLTGARVIDASEVTKSEGDWTFVDKRAGSYAHYYSTDKPGAWMEFKFSGERVGPYVILGGDSSCFTWYIDGREATDMYGTFIRLHPCTIPYIFEYGEHTCRVVYNGFKNSDDKKPGIICAFLIS